MSINIEKSKDYIKFKFSNDKFYEKLKLLVILSPILIASFDNSDNKLNFLRKEIQKSKFSYSLYPQFFNDFNIGKYRDQYENYICSEDIYLDLNNNINFKINYLEDEYIKALKTIIEVIIINDDNRRKFLDYFKEIRDDIVINGRRSILSNGIQGFYLSKYVVVRMILICEYIKDYDYLKFKEVIPIYNLADNLKTPGYQK